MASLSFVAPSFWVYIRESSSLSDIKTAFLPLLFVIRAQINLLIGFIDILADVSPTNLVENFRVRFACVNHNVGKCAANEKAWRRPSFFQFCFEKLFFRFDDGEYHIGDGVAIGEGIIIIADGDGKVILIREVEGNLVILLFDSDLALIGAAEGIFASLF